MHLKLFTSIFTPIRLNGLYIGYTPVGHGNLKLTSRASSRLTFDFIGED
jgi:hypothetical protein